MTPYFAVVDAYFCPLLSLGPEYRVLGSHHILHKEKKFEKWQEIYSSERNIFFLDSGAFSVFNSGLPLINIKDYMATIQALKPYVYATMDVIGNAGATYNNTRFLLVEGFNPVPVVHMTSTYEEVKKYTELYLNELGCRHLAIGGVAQIAYTDKEVQKKVRLFWSLIQKYWPVKVHLFGKFDANWLMDYPYHSSDSSGWMNASRFGELLTVPNQKHLRTKKIHHSQFLDSRSEKYKLLFKTMTLPRGVIKSPRFINCRAGEIKGYIIRNLIQAMIYKDLIFEVTKYWASRGIVWGPEPKSNAKPPIKWAPKNHKKIT